MEELITAIWNNSFALSFNTDCIQVAKIKNWETKPDKCFSGIQRNVRRVLLSLGWNAEETSPASQKTRDLTIVPFADFCPFPVILVNLFDEVGQSNEYQLALEQLHNLRREKFQKKPEHCTFIV